MRQVKQAEITGEDFYNKYIKTGGFVFFPEVMALNTMDCHRDLQLMAAIAMRL